MDMEPIGVKYLEVMGDWKYSTVYLVEQIRVKIKEAERLSIANFPKWKVRIDCYNRREAQDAYSRLSSEERKWCLFKWNYFLEGDERPLDETTKTGF